MIEEVEGLDKLEALQNHANEIVYEKALEIIQTYFAEADSDGEFVGEVRVGFNRFFVLHFLNWERLG